MKDILQQDLAEQDRKRDRVLVSLHRAVEVHTRYHGPDCDAGQEVHRHGRSVHSRTQREATGDSHRLAVEQR